MVPDTLLLKLISSPYNEEERDFFFIMMTSKIKDGHVHCSLMSCPECSDSQTVWFIIMDFIVEEELRLLRGMFLVVIMSLNFRGSCWFSSRTLDSFLENTIFYLDEFKFINLFLTF
uniref:Uncharacterized protein n=1 Tax=Cacopsylla melanoneura TaxID=428564 RepID=A0A8D9E9L0_9HEMI